MKRMVSGPSYKWWVLVAVSIGTFMITLDISLIMVCLPQLARIFHTDSSAIGWVNIAYVIAGLSLMLSLARVGDVSGRRKVYTIGLGLYTFGLLACAFSQNIIHLVCARALQGVGAAAVASLSTAITVAVFPGHERGKALGALAGISSIGLIVGPILGGLILDLLDWQALFYTRLPVGVVGLVMTAAEVAEQKERTLSFELDLAGSLALCGALTSVLLFLNFAHRTGFSSPASLLAAAFSLVCGVAFFLFETRAAQPVVDLGLFRNRVFASAIVTSGIQSVAMTAMIFLVPFYLEGLGYSASMVGVFIGLLAVPFLLVFPVSGRLSDRIGATVLSTWGMVLFCVALLLLTRLTERSTGWVIIAGLWFVGAGHGTFQTSNSSAVMGSVPRDRLGTASGLLTAVRQLGMSAALAVAGSVFAGRVARHSAGLAGSGLDRGMVEKLSITGGFQDVILMSGLFALLGIATSVVARRSEGISPAGAGRR